MFTKIKTATRLDAPAKTVFGVRIVDKGRARPGNNNAPGSQSRTNAVSSKWLAEKKASAAARQARVANHANTAPAGRLGARGPGASSGAGSWVRGRAGASTTGPVYGRSGGVGAGRTGGAGGGAVMGSKRLVGRGAQTMAAFHDMRAEFEARKTNIKYGAGAGARGRGPPGPGVPRLPLGGSGSASSLGAGRGGRTGLSSLGGSSGARGGGRGGAPAFMGRSGAGPTASKRPVSVFWRLPPPPLPVSPL